MSSRAACMDDLPKDSAGDEFVGGNKDGILDLVTSTRGYCNYEASNHIDSDDCNTASSMKSISRRKHWSLLKTKILYHR